MAENSTTSLKILQAENKRLKADNKLLRNELAAYKNTNSGKSKRRPLRSIGIIILVALAAALLVVGNLFFWAGNTIVKTDRWVEATSPIIQNHEVQSALAANINEQLFKNVDIEQLSKDVLPPRAEFLAPTIASQVKNHAEGTVKKILQRPQFQERWNGAQARAHDRFISAVESHGSDGSIDISEVYTNVSGQLKDTKLAFLADKPLPSKVGEIELVSGGWLTVLQKTIQNIDTWRTAALILLVLVSAAAVWLSRRRRYTVIVLGSFFAAGMFITLVSGRLAREIIAGNAKPENAEAVRQAYTIFMHLLTVQTATIMVAALLVVLIAWVTGPWRSSAAFRLRINQLLSGRLHAALFKHENSFTNWLGRNKIRLQWLAVALIGLSTLFIRLTPGALLTQIILIVVIVFVLEILAAPRESS